MSGSPFAIGCFRAGSDEPFPGLVLGATVVDLREHLGDRVTTRQLLQDWDAALSSLRDLARRPRLAGQQLEDLRPLAPIEPPAQLFCAGANYRRHLRQMVLSMGRQASDGRSEAQLHADADDALRERTESGAPFVFSVQPSALSGARDDVVLWGPGHQHDWELELAVVVGRSARHVSEEDALEYVAGYAIANDISTRDVMHRPNFAMTDFLMTKGRPTFKPIGPYVVPREFAGDYRKMRMQLSVNGQVMQDEHADDMIYGVEQLIAYVSAVTELWPGDILLTGSPAGNAGHHGDRWLRPGDVIEATISGLGRQQLRCVAPAAQTERTATNDVDE